MSGVPHIRLFGPTLLALLLAACSSVPKPMPEPSGEPPKPTVKTPTKKPAVTLKRGGGYYKDDGPADEIPDGLDEVPDAEPKLEPLHRFANRPYVVFGKEYVPNTSVKPYKTRGIGSWYGKKFHGQKTSIGEPYDMFSMTAAHPTLAIPSYVRVTSVANGRSVIVRVTDRGPFHADRVIDLSYAAAHKLDYIRNGSSMVEVEAIVPDAAGVSYAQVSPIGSKPAAARVEAPSKDEIPAGAGGQVLAADRSRLRAGTRRAGRRRTPRTGVADQADDRLSDLRRDQAGHDQARPDVPVSEKAWKAKGSRMFIQVNTQVKPSKT
jgi:rare lipoprotein A (peptidoglycan hydrolase)